MSEPKLSQREVLVRLRPGDRLGDAAVGILLKKADETGGRQAPWFVRAMVAVSAWIASILFLTFMFGSGLVKNWGGGIMLGLLIMIGAVTLARMKRDSPFLSQFGLALSIAGQVLFIGGVGDKMTGTAASLAAVLASVALIALYPDRNHRFISTLVAVGGMVNFVYNAELSYGLQVLSVCLAAAGGHLWFGESRLISGLREAMLRPVAYGLIIGALGLLTPSIAPSGLYRHFMMESNWILASLALTVLLLLLEYRILAVHDRLGYIGVASLLLTYSPIPCDTCCHGPSAPHTISRCSLSCYMPGQ